MRALFWRLGLYITVLAATSGVCARGQEYIREQRTVTVGGVNEVWRLVWIGKPQSVCGPDEIDMAITCPCTGFAYGQLGKLALVRLRQGREIERLNLGPLFDTGMDNPDGNAEPGTAFLQERPILPNDWQRSFEHHDPRLMSEIENRSRAPIMNFVDYNRDGYATKFLLQVGEMPCGKREFVAVGTSASNSRLHALASAAHPEQPLIMLLSEWEVLLKGPGPYTVTTGMCGDHGSEEYNDAIIRASHGNIHVTNRAFTCSDKLSPGKLIKETAG